LATSLERRPDTTRTGRESETPELLAREAERTDLQLRTVTRRVNGGRAAARDEGWRTARGELIAFTDDDCVPAPEWLAAGLATSAQHHGSIVQGRTEPIAEELERLGPLSRPFARTIRVPELDHAFQTCNIFYPRSLLERVGGFDTVAFGRAPGGEDADLGWRGVEAGGRVAFAPDAVVHHAVNSLGPAGKLRHALRWSMRAYARHPELRRAHFVRGIFWKGSHYLLVRALIALVLPRRWRLVRAWLGYPYLIHLFDRGRVEGGGPLLTPYYALYDLVELAATARQAVRHRTPML
jgi:GT2 family glycosyltransferase